METDEIISILQESILTDVVEENGELSIYFNSHSNRSGKIIVECPVIVIRENEEIINTSSIDELENESVISALKSIVDEHVKTIWVDREKLILYLNKSEVTFHVRAQEDDEFSVNIDKTNGVIISYEFRSDFNIESLRYEVDS